MLQGLLGAVLVLTFLIAGPAVPAGKGKKKDPDARLYARKCGGSCHRLYKPREHTGPQWAAIVEKMAPRARLTEEQAERITAYLVEHAWKEDSEEPEEPDPKAP